jgi:hypothetical protein
MLGAAALALALAGSASASQDSLPKFPPFPKVKVRTDGTLTVGGQETLYVSHVPRRPKMTIAAFISAPNTADECFVSFNAYCMPEPLFPVAGTPRLRASKKGRSRLTFVMPAAYEFLNFNDPLRSHPVPLANAQAVRVTVEGTVRQHGIAFSTDIGATTAAVEVPPAP